MSTSSTSPIYFNGTSTFSGDLQQVITQAVTIASIPINQLNDTVSTLTNQQSALSSLSGTFTSLQSALAGIDTAVGSGNYSVSSSNSSVATASASSGALLGAYTLQVVDPGSQASAASTATVTDPSTQSISSSPSFTLTANGTTYSNIMPPAGTTSLDSLVTAINTATQGAVQATIVNVGTPSQPAYELSIQNTAYGALPIALTDNNGNNLLGTPTTADSVEYTVDGQPPSGQPPLSSDTQTLTLSPNLTVTALAEGTTTITVGQSTSNIANALSSFVSAYNAATQALTAQRGSSGGALSGEGVIDTLSQSLQSLVNYSGTGSIQSIADLGLTFNDTTGALSFNPSVLSTAAASDFTGVTSFLGGATGGGFLQAATTALTSILDPVSGIIPAEIASTTGEITADNNKISQDQTNINQLQSNLTQQMAAADALIAETQSQNSYMTNLFTSMTANQNQNSNG